MDEEHSDEYMDDTNKQYEYMDEEHSDEYMDDTNKQYEEQESFSSISDDINRPDQNKPSQKANK
jgi:hypothetical protein